jgi:hypothetical protein
MSVLVVDTNVVSILFNRNIPCGRRVSRLLWGSSW